MRPVLPKPLIPQWAGPIAAAVMLVIVTVIVYNVVHEPSIDYDAFTDPKPPAEVAALKAAAEALAAAALRLDQKGGAAKPVATKSTPAAQAKTELPKLHGLLWGSSAMLFMTVSIAALVILSRTVFPVLQAPRRHIVFYLTTASPLLLMLFLPGSPFGFDSYMPGGLLTLLDKHVLTGVLVMWVLTLVASWLVIAGAATCICHVSNAEELYEANTRLQMILFTGAAILAAGVVEIDALYQWAASKKGITPEQAKVIIQSVVVPTGTFFSLYLAAAYIPAALVLRKSGQTLAEAANPAPNIPARAKWLQEHGIATSVAAQVTAVFALFSPALLASGPLRAMASAFG